MSYTALGYDITIGTPFGNKTISVPIEQMANDAGAMAINAVWPPLKAQLEAELATQLPIIINKVEAQFPKLLSQAEASVVNDLWPKMQPKLRTELNYVLGQARTEIRHDLWTTLAVLGGVIGLHALWTGRRKRLAAAGK